jgi:hypothetical protein
MKFERYIRQLDGSGYGVEDVAFEPGFHGWNIPLDESCAPYGIEECFDSLEAKLIEGGQRVLREASRLCLREKDVPAFSNGSLALIQSGWDQAIFQIDTETLGEKPIVAGMSRRPVSNELVRRDCQEMRQLRGAEAAFHRMDPGSTEFERISMFTRHFSCHETPNGPCFQLTPFERGWVEVNAIMLGDSFPPSQPPAPRIAFNGQNQGEKSILCEPDRSAFYRAKIAFHQITTALRCEQNIFPSIQAGDYLFSAASESMKLHTYRGAWGEMNGVEVPVEEGGKKIRTLAIQLLSMATWKEQNPEHKACNPNERFLVLSTLDILSALGFTLQSTPGILNKKELIEVADLLLKIWERNIALYALRPEFEDLFMRVEQLTQTLRIMAGVWAD